jgi:hypothetical protein
LIKGTISSGIGQRITYNNCVDVPQRGLHRLLPN